MHFPHHMCLIITPDVRLRRVDAALLRAAHFPSQVFSHSALFSSKPGSISILRRRGWEDKSGLCELSGRPGSGGRCRGVLVLLGGPTTASTFGGFGGRLFFLARVQSVHHILESWFSAVANLRSRWMIKLVERGKVPKLRVDGLVTLQQQHGVNLINNRSVC
ncbi:hypothetical protein B0T11DRAFT_64593 [Plectosphaerella cucumerina]|uniref:Uncharacterized protein n=1 Tax=Plectosphaerella cucumerina TaxID=40658 RepID=A0A8K0TPS2_9PEZI|nr:hypothetical protein B0T11DRAFT_64593 [Plectosphaerella cucumerina]